MSRLRKVICEKISQITKNANIYYELEVPPKRLQNPRRPTLNWPVNNKEQEDLSHQIIKLDFDKEVVHRINLLPAVDKQPAKVEFVLHPDAFAEAALSKRSDIKPQSEDAEQPRVVLDFSSPNIAKPFHVGHLRSTIIGNTLANLHENLGYAVTKLNYLGDWGTQFGLLQVGVELAGITDEEMRQRPMEMLYNAYVMANTEAKLDAQITDKARKYFSELESGTNAEMSRQWEQYRQYTIEELKSVYARLGVHFDQYDWESQYSRKDIFEVLKDLARKKLLYNEVDGRKIVLVDGRHVPIIKSDGTTLYLARDIAALLDRYRRFKFESMLYVVDNSQTDHFNACFKTTTALCDEINLEQLKHVKFGRIRGMSTRAGSTIFLRDVLDEARDIMLEKQLKSPTTKVDLSTADNICDKSTADVLGISAVIVNDLKQRRQRDYDFDWQKALQVNGDTGIKLQYTHCRLSNLLEAVADIDVTNVKPNLSYLPEYDAQDLLFELARFDQILWSAKEHLEPCILVNYLFGLCNTTSRALKYLNVKRESNLNKQRHRILMFEAAKDVLKRGMEILGLKPLTKM